MGHCSYPCAPETRATSIVFSYLFWVIKTEMLDFLYGKVYSAKLGMLQIYHAHFTIAFPQMYTDRVTEQENTHDNT